MDDTVVLVAFITAAATLLAPLIPKWWSAKAEKRKLKKDEEQQFREARRIAYHKFIQVFSTSYSGDTEKYLSAALDAAEFGNVILPQPIKLKNKEICSLDNLIEVIIRLRTENRYEPESGIYEDIPDYVYDEWGDKFDKLRAKAALDFSPLFMEILLRKP